MKVRITKIDDRDTGFQVDWTDDTGPAGTANNNHSQIFLPRPKEKEQMEYAKELLLKTLGAGIQF